MSCLELINWKVSQLLGYVYTAADEFSTGWKIWPDDSYTLNFSIYLLCLRKWKPASIFETFVSGFTHAQSAT